MNHITTTTGFNALSQQQRQEHRALVGVRAQAILSQFWQDDEHDGVRAMILEGWMDVLQHCTHDEIRAAWADYQRHGPRTDRGKLIRPDAGAIYRRVIAKRPKPKPVDLARNQQAPRVSRERANEIVKEIGFKPRKFGEGAA